MRKEQFGIGDYVHVYNRGNRKQAIVRDDNDRRHFLQMLYYFNTETTFPNPFQDLKSRPSLRLSLNDPGKFIWPDHWPARKPIVEIISFILMGNHFHLILKEITKNGITRFMHRLGTGMTMNYNTRYKEQGRLFQGVYKAKVINQDLYFRHLSVYIQVKNCFELYSQGFTKAINNFCDAYKFALNYPYGSLSHYYGKISSPILNKEFLLDLFVTPNEYKTFSEEDLFNLKERLGDLALD